MLVEMFCCKLLLLPGKLSLFCCQHASAASFCCSQENLSDLIGYDIYMHLVPEWIKWYSEHFNLQAVKGHISMRVILEWIKWYNVLIYRLP